MIDARTPGILFAVWLVYSVIVTFAVGGSGLGMMMRKKWALPYMFVAGIGMMPGFPVGTVVGGWMIVAWAKLRAIHRSKQR